MTYISSPEFRCWRMCILSSSELCEDEDGSTSETPESAGLGGKDHCRSETDGHPRGVRSDPLRPGADRCAISVMIHVAASGAEVRVEAEGRTKDHWILWNRSTTCRTLKEY